MLRRRVVPVLCLAWVQLGLQGCGDDSQSGDAEATASEAENSAASEADNSASESNEGVAAATSEASESATSDTGDTGDTSAECEADFAQGLPGSISLPAIQTHLQAFQSHADDHGGTRASGTPGHVASSQYVFDQLQAAGYEVVFQDFEFEGFVEDSPTIFEQVAPTATEYTAPDDFIVIAGSGDGDVTASVTAVDLELGVGNNSNSACQSSDFDSFPAGNIALVQRGSCTFIQKVENAQAAGAAAVVMFNQGNNGDASRNDPMSISVDANGGTTIPGVFVSYASGEAFDTAINGGPLTLRIAVDATTALSTRNVIAQSPGGDPDDVLMLGAHLDSVLAGPGINDNASGSAALLELAVKSAACAPQKRLRFAWWGAEEFGLLGSAYYVDQLDAAARDQISAYLNFDMLSSPNFARFVHDGDGSDFDPGPAGSAEIEQVFLDWFAAESLETIPAELDNRSDYGPFADVGIAVGGLATGAEGIKSDGVANAFGGTAGDPFDSCYHRACDTIDNVNTTVLLQNAEAIGYAIATLAF